jgi:hemerythrin-like domain-containing protein
MSHLTDHLRLEHRRLRRLLAVFARQLDALSDGYSPDFPLMRDLVEYLETYADPRHHGVENQVIAALERHAPDVAEPCGILITDHRNLAKLGAATSAALDDLLAGAVARKDTVLGPACDYLRLYRAHLDREQDLLLSRLSALDPRIDGRAVAGISIPSPQALGNAERYDALDTLIRRLTADADLEELDVIHCRACDTP